MSSLPSVALPAVPSSSSPLWLPVAAALGVAWNVFGAVRFVGSVGATARSFEEMGLTPAQAEVMAAVPLWLTLAFATGVFGGLAGCVLLLLRRRQAVPVLLASLCGYVVLFVGDVVEGVFAALGPPQVIILSTVLAIAAALAVVGRTAARRDFLR